MREEERHDLGMADSVEAEAVGVPGKRTFKITAASPRGAAVVWMEKEQLFQVAVSIKRFLAAGAETAAPDLHATSPRPGAPVVAEFKVGEMSLRYDASTGILTLIAAAIEPPEDAEPPGLGEAPAEVEFSFTRPMAETLAERALEACAAGRRPCPFCGGPMDPEGHFCVRTNGHQELDLPSE